MARLLAYSDDAMTMISMTCDQVLAAIGLNAQREVFAPAWSAQPVDDGFLTPAALLIAAAEIGLAEVHCRTLLNGLDMFVTIPELRVLAAQLRWQYCQRDDPAPTSYPMLSRTLHPVASLFHAYVVLGCVADTCAFNARRGIPAAISHAVFADLGRWLDEHQRAKGFAGFDRMGWLWQAISGRLHQLGRLQFNLATWTAPVRAFRHKDTGEVVLLMIAGQAMRADGRHQGISGSAPDVAGFTTTFVESAEGWCGHLVSARGVATHGVAERALTQLSSTAWTAALTPGSPILFLHIPAGGGLTPVACGDSCRQALDFFPRYFPDQPFAAIVSVSWMFDPQLANYLPAESNLVRFQHSFHLHPHADLSGSQIRERVLGSVDADWRTVTPTTSLQQVVIAHYRAGCHWCQHGAVLFPDEVARAFGT